VTSDRTDRRYDGLLFAGVHLEMKLLETRLNRSDDERIDRFHEISRVLEVYVDRKSGKTEDYPVGKLRDGIEEDLGGCAFVKKEMPQIFKVYESKIRPSAVC